MRVLSAVSRLFKAYHNVVIKYPVAVQSVQTALLTGTSDVIAQTVIEKKHLGEFDIKRCLAFAGFGGLIGPFLRLWFGLLDSKLTGSRNVVVVQKVLLDQLVMVPCTLFVFLSAVNAAEGKGVEEIKQKLKEDYVNVLISNYKVWPAVQLINFYLIPINYQVPVTQIVGVFWNTYLSWKIHHAPDKSDVD